MEEIHAKHNSQTEAVKDIDRKNKSFSWVMVNTLNRERNCSVDQF